LLVSNACNDGAIGAVERITFVMSVRNINDIGVLAGVSDPVRLSTRVLGAFRSLHRHDVAAGEQLRQILFSEIAGAR